MLGLEGVVVVDFALGYMQKDCLSTSPTLERKQT